MKLLKIFYVAIVFIVFACNSNTETNNDNTTNTDEKAVVQDTNGIFVEINTARGLIKGNLDYKNAPLTVANFVALVEGTMPNNFKKTGENFFDTLKFHRIISYSNGDKQDFMIQGGDPKNDGTGGPGYQFRDEFTSPIRFDRPGVFAMANSGKNTNGSQFFITLAACGWLDGVHSTFGMVTEGQSVVSVIKPNDKMISVKIIRKGKEAQAFDAMKVFNELKDQQ